MQMYAALWVGGETDTGLYCPLRGQGALWSYEREDGVVPTPPRPSLPEKAHWLQPPQKEIRCSTEERGLKPP